MFNLRGIDLNLLPIFEAVYEERSLSRAATRLSMTQSAVSHALSRLRAMFRNELFIRQTRGVVPTPVAERIYGGLRNSLTSVRESIAQTRDFDPRTSSRQFFVGIAHPLGPMIAVRLHERLVLAAPNVEVAFSTRSRPVELEQAMHDGRMDAAVDWLPPRRRELCETRLFDDGVVAVTRRGNPALARMSTVNDLKKARFVSLRRRIDGEHPVPGIRDWLRLDLDFALEVSELLEVFMVASQSDLLGLIPRTMIRFANDTFGLAPLAAAPRTVPVPISLLWPASRKADPSHAFLRKQIMLASADVVPHVTSKTRSLVAA